MSVVLFGVWPYIALAVCVVGHVWRWRSDQFGWTSRTSELMEKRWLALGSPLFHFGALFVILGHAVGLLVPASATAALGIPETVYHTLALVIGLIAGIVFFAGAVILGLRRYVTKARFRLITRPADAAMYAILLVVALAGLSATVGLNIVGDGYDYRETVSVWFRSIFTLQPDVDALAAAPWIFQVHAVGAFALIAIWPFTRLVHVWSIPLGYLVRPPIVYHAPRP
ncbi:MAG: respiratory nitrate reductase subunit gamma [Propionibacteriaceae bacterium]|jgi:nitrate reductase gamma subunit|nr:respiratory nitrate reductase subunit gamma [Propionibacteriaceae bacterium]